jgi:sterol desaturase/sphingolipid hydroxylase (fatty acid hydroxylase superfamily)
VERAVDRLKTKWKKRVVLFNAVNTTFLKAVLILMAFLIAFLYLFFMPLECANQFRRVGQIRFWIQAIQAFSAEEHELT